MKAQTLTPAAKGVRAALPAGHRRKGKSKSDGWWPWLFVVPTVAGIGVFYLWPIVQTFYYSFTKWGVFGGTKFIGLDNYVRMFVDSTIPQSIVNTLVYTVVVLLGSPIAVILASLIERPGLRVAALYRTLYFIPYITMPAAVGMGI